MKNRVFLVIGIAWSAWAMGAKKTVAFDDTPRIRCIISEHYRRTSKAELDCMVRSLDLVDACIHITRRHMMSAPSYVFVQLQERLQRLVAEKRSLVAKKSQIERLLAHACAY